MGEPQPRKAIVNQLRAESRRATEFEHRAARAELAERNLTAELQRARARIVELEERVARGGSSAIAIGGTVAVIARIQARADRA